MSEQNQAPFSYVPPTAPENVVGNVSTHPLTASESAAERIKAQAWYIISQGGWVFWNIAELQEGEILLPSFVTKKEDGYYLDLTVFERNPRAFYEFADRTFASWAYLFKLDYPAFSKLVHDPAKSLEIKKELEEKGVPAELRFATDIVRISEERRPLYRSVKVAPSFSDAKYLFEPLFIDRETKNTDENGEEFTTTEQVKAKLDFDEFVAHLWNRGVRHWLLEADIRGFIDSDPPKFGWETVARQTDPTKGSDATTKELSERLHQDRAPQILDWWRIDLRHWKNRFPQVNEGEKLLEKIPRELGTAWMNVGGIPIEPDLPKDFNLAALAGEWTKIEEIGWRTLLVSSMNGFIDIDVKTSTISVSEKIIHREGANMRQTWSLDLEGEHFEEHGEVDNGIEITGHSMHFKSYVAGTIYSNSWTVVTEGNVSGSVFSKGDAVHLKGKAVQNGRIECRNGEITANMAINSVLIGKKVVVQHARNCIIIAEEIVVEKSEGSALAASRTVHVRASDVDPMGEATVITVEIPDINELSAPLAEVRESLKKKEADLTNLHAGRQALQKECDRLSSEELVKKYLEQAKKVKDYLEGGGILTKEQSALFERMKSAVKPKLLELQEKRKKMGEFNAAISALDLQIAPLVMLRREHEEALRKSFQGISVTVDGVFWETVLRTRLPKLPAVQESNGLRQKEKEPDPKALVAKRISDYENVVEMRREAFDRGTVSERKFDAKAGNISWAYDEKSVSTKTAS